MDTASKPGDLQSDWHKVAGVMAHKINWGRFLAFPAGEKIATGDSLVVDDHGMLVKATGDTLWADIVGDAPGNYEKGDLVKVFDLQTHRMCGGG